MSSFPDRKFFVKADSGKDNRQTLQNAIDSCSNAGGGIVFVNKGEYALNGNIVMKSDVNLYLDEGAVLLFSGIPDDFLPAVYTRWEGTELFGRSPMIYALHANNIAITGKGTIDANAGREFYDWNKKEKHDVDMLREMGDKLVPLYKRQFANGTLLRPCCIEFIGCSRVLLDGVTVKDSPFWTIHPVYCDNVIVKNLTIDSHFPNNDGCDPESTTNVLIENCIFNTGDDSVAIKSGRDTDGRNIGRPSKNIVIRNCLFNSLCNGLCIGSEMSGGVENVYMYNIEIKSVKNAIYFKSNRDRGGYIRNVFVDNISIGYTSGAMLRFESNYFGHRGGNYSSLYDNFKICNVTGDKSENYAIFMDGLKDMPIRNITIENFSVKDAKYPYYMYNAKNIYLNDVEINGKKISHNMKESPNRKTLDVY